MTPLERAARALCEAARRNPDALEPGVDPYSDNTEIIDGTLPNGDPAFFVWRLYAPQARAVLEAIREPSEKMIGVGSIPHLTVALRWQAMIDTALAEG